MTQEVHRTLCKTMAKRGGMFPGMAIPEFYELVHELFTTEEAAVTNAIPRGLSPASVIAKEMGKTEEEIAAILEKMADKGLCISGEKDGISIYAGLFFVLGIFEFQFLRGTETKRDKKTCKTYR